ncbi:hypothetical protein Cgig2_022188 [Carnegiea gigantea]|uniref:Uncharacterized protein n=1 Tax=Carnegiea gigantea TaxID=171969 RepID=A0A9Q1GN43_9CARY|nr:hypothetical protein Cgig2_022188 [Carnegiea gigantea]
MRPHSRTRMVNPGRGTMIGSSRPPPGRVAAPTKASRPSPPPPRHPTQLIPANCLVRGAGANLQTPKGNFRLATTYPGAPLPPAHASFTENENPPSPSRGMKCSTEVVPTITRGYAEGMTPSAWKAQLRGTQQVLAVEQGLRMTVAIIVFDGRKAPHFASPHNDPLLVEEVNPTGMIRLPSRFGDKFKARNLETDFLVVDVPTAYNIILGRPTLHRVKAVIAPYLL